MENRIEKKSKVKVVFGSRLAPKKGAASTDVGIPVSSELQARMPVVVAAGRTTRR